MKAAVRDRYGPPQVVGITEVPMPVPRKGEVLVRVQAAALTAADARIRAARFPRGFAPFARLAFGVRRPRNKVLGSCFSGTVHSVGEDVAAFATGDEVCGTTGISMGAHAQYLRVPAGRILSKPTAVHHRDAAGMLFGGTTALHYLRDKASLASGAKVLVNGASGAVGTNAVQLAAYLGGTVTGVTSTGNMDLVSALGARHVIDYTCTALGEIAERFDIVLDTVGNINPSAGRTLLAHNGVLLLAVANLRETVTAHGNVKVGPAPERVADMGTLLELMVNGHLVSVTDRVFDLADIVQAHERVDSGRKVGNVIITPAGD